MNEGTIKFFNEAKGFGFITPSNGGADLFVHVTGLNGQVRENDKVSYDVTDGQKGPTATNVNVI
ncbi:cold-shock protein [Flavobacterium sp. J49]|uniref:cold-shock protein n=1 Tax=Flavobacterium sp. J49 TaxID=2718534 RepID=UPI001593FB46|nr:cold-shock protein [Flavobacterium sp. J49]MBF6642180.1 cold-shock protein [Flavobacterium sp. J49]NIC03427.1 cold-shock protein [Flavobacterium sp. J49]